MGKKKSSGGRSGSPFPGEDAKRQQAPVESKPEETSTSASPRISRNEWISLAVILILGLLLRVWFLAEIVHAPDFCAPQQDPDVQDYHARAILSGDWTVREGENDPEMGTTPYFRPPGHAYFLAAIYFFTDGSYLAPRIVNMGLGLAAVVVMFLLVRAIFGSAAGLIAAFFMSTYWGFVFWEGELNDPCLFVFLGTCIMYALYRWTCTMAPGWAALTGLMVGSYALMRPNILGFGPFMAAWMLGVAWRHGKIRRIPLSWLALAACTFLLVTPVTIRNYVVSGEFVPISTYFGENFLIGNGEDSDGVTPWTPYLQDLEGTGNWSVWVYNNVVKGLEKSLNRPITHSEASDYFFQEGLHYAAEHKLRTLKLAFKKAILFWTPIEITCNKVIYYEKRFYPPVKYLPGFAMAMAAFVFGVACLLRDLWRKRDLGAPDPAKTKEMIALLGAFILVYFASFLPFFVNGRARIPIIPFMFLFGAYGLSHICQRITQRQWKLAGISCASLFILYGFASIQYVRFEPDLARWYYQRAESYERTGQMDKAVEAASHILDMDSAASYMNMRLGRLFAKRGLKEEAFQQFMAAVRHHPDDPDVRFNGAYELIKIGKVAEGIAHYEEILRQNPNDARVHNNLGLLMEEQQNYEAAIKHYEVALRIDPAYALAHTNLGNLLAKLGQTDKAVLHFLKAVELEPKQEDYHYNLAIHLAEMGRTDEAIERYRTALQLNPGDARAHNNLALLLAGRGLYDEAGQHYADAVRIVPGFALAYANWGNMFADQGKFEDALAMYQRGFAAAPADASLHNGLGFVYERAGQLDNAAREYEEALRLVPQYPLALNNLGNVAARQGDTDRALRLYEQVLKIDPNDRFAHFNMANVLAEQGRLDDAISHYLAGAKNDPSNAVLFNNLANVMVRKSRFDEAIQYYKRASELDPRYVAPHLNLGTVLAAVGKIDDAAVHFRRVLELDPANASAKEGLAKIQQGK